MGEASEVLRCRLVALQRAEDLAIEDLTGERGRKDHGMAEGMARADLARDLHLAECPKQAQRVGAQPPLAGEKVELGAPSDEVDDSTRYLLGRR